MKNFTRMKQAMEMADKILSLSADLALLIKCWERGQELSRRRLILIIGGKDARSTPKDDKGALENHGMGPKD